MIKESLLSIKLFPIKRIKMNKKLFTTILAYAAISAALAQTRPSVPRLVVGITIDKLRSDYLQAFAPLYREDGLKKLLNQGQVFTNVQYPFNSIDRASSIATIATGTSPYNHGIISDKWLDRKALHTIFCVDDNAYQGVNTSDCSSAKNLLVSTIGDELKVATNGKARVISIAPNREAAVLAAGHAADWAMWIDSNTGRWAGTTYYTKEPAWFKTIHNTNAARIPKLTWTPIQPYNYNFYLACEQKEFSHTFKGDYAYRQYKNSSLVNEDITAAAKQCIYSNDVATDEVPDYLSLCYYAGNFDSKSLSETTTEIQDTYIRLDYEISELLRTLDQAVGLDKTLIYVTSTGYDDTPNDQLTKYNIPTGTFYINKCATLLNMYLVAIYGQGKYVEAFHDNQIYLNHSLLEQKHIKLSEIFDCCDDFLFQFSGVRDVFTSQRIIQGALTPGIKEIHEGFNTNCSGDILIHVDPGWTLENQDTGSKKLQRDSFIEFPLIFFGYNLKPQTVNTPVTTECIAPTVAHHIRIRAPNACKAAPLY